MTLFISHVHEEIRRARFTRRGATALPKDVPVGLHKEYPRMEKVMLPAPQELKVDLTSVLKNRKSYFGGSEKSTIPLQQWGTLLGLSLQKREGSTSRNYPSGGALFPVETYVITTLPASKDLAVFHYNPTLHALEKLWGLEPTFDLRTLATCPEYTFFSAIIVFTSVWTRSSAKYGDLTYSHALIESGHMSENIVLVATALDILSRPMAGFNDERLITLLDIDPAREQPIHSVVLSGR